MRTLTRSLLPLFLVVLFGSCSLQDHLGPQPSSCKTTEVQTNLDYYKIPAGQTVNIGDVISGLFTTYPVIDIITINGNNYAVGGPEYSIQYTYYPDGKVKRSYMTGRTLSNAIFIHEYSYATNKVTEVYKQKLKTFPDTIVTTQVYDLNSDGVAIRDNITYTNGYLTENRNVNYVETYTIENGNTTKKVWSPTPTGVFAGEQPRVTDFEFDLTAPNPVPTLFPFWGKPNQNKLIKVYYREDNVREDHQYIFDAQGNLKFEVNILIRENEPDRYFITGYKTDC